MTDIWTSLDEPGHPFSSVAPGVTYQQLLQVGTVVRFGVQVFVAQLGGLQGNAVWDSAVQRQPCMPRVFSAVHFSISSFRASSVWKRIWLI
jgi:hypothetical protein